MAVQPRATKPATGSARTLLFLLLGCVSGGLVRAAPYPHSTAILSISWDWATYRTGAVGSDLWPVTWGPDDQLYSAWGDGGGFGGSDSDGRVALGFARIEGGPEDFRGFNVNGGKNPEHPASFAKKGKTTGVLFVSDILYASVNLENGVWPDVDHALFWSTNTGATWPQTDWVFSKGNGHFQPAKFLNFGRDYTGLPDSLAGYVYIYGPRQSAEPGNGKALFLARTPQQSVRDRSAYTYFRSTENPDAPPNWTSDPTEATPVFIDKNGVTPGSVIFVPSLQGFLLTAFHTGPGELGVFEAPHPWGPWRTVAYYNDWGGMGTEGEGLSCNFTQKWMSRDGRTLWAVFSVYGEGAKQGVGAHDRFNLVRARLNLQRP